MIAVILFKLAASSSVIFLLMLLIDSFCKYEDAAKGHLKTKVPAVVPLLGFLSFVVMVVTSFAGVIVGIWV